MQKNNLWNLKVTPTLENSHMRLLICGKTAKITGKVLSNTISEEMETKAGGKKWQLEEVQAQIKSTFTN